MYSAWNLHFVTKARWNLCQSFGRLAIYMLGKLRYLKKKRCTRSIYTNWTACGYLLNKTHCSSNKDSVHHGNKYVSLWVSHLIATSMRVRWKLNGQWLLLHNWLYEVYLRSYNLRVRTIDGIEFIVTLEFMRRQASRMVKMQHTVGCVHVFRLYF